MAESPPGRNQLGSSAPQDQGSKGFPLQPANIESLRRPDESDADLLQQESIHSHNSACHSTSSVPPASKIFSCRAIMASKTVTLRFLAHIVVAGPGAWTNGEVPGH